jgi:hypothetical protein
MAQDELTHPGPFGHAADLADVGVQRGHPGQFELVRAVPCQVVQVGHLVHEDVGSVGQRDQVLVHGGVAGEHHRPVRRVEPVRQRRDRPAVRDRHRPDPDGGILEHHDRRRGGRESNVDAPDQRTRIRHPRIQRHDVQVIGERGQHMADQIRRAGGGLFRIDRGHAVEDRIALRQRLRPWRPVHPDRRQRSVLARPQAPRVQDHPRQVAKMVDVQVGQEHRLQPDPAQPGLGVGRGCPAPAVHHEHPPVDGDRR